MEEKVWRRRRETLSGESTAETRQQSMSNFLSPPELVKAKRHATRATPPEAKRFASCTDGHGTKLPLSRRKAPFHDSADDVLPQSCQVIDLAKVLAGELLDTKPSRSVSVNSLASLLIRDESLTNLAAAGSTRYDTPPCSADAFESHAIMSLCLAPKKRRASPVSMHSGAPALLADLL